MFTTRIAVFLVPVLLAGAPAIAGAPQLTCFGNEPSWSVVLEGAGDGARLALPDEPSIAYRGRASELSALHERAWRGRADAGSGGDLVVFLRDGACSDTMSDTTHPVIARVSLADGRLLAGCCRIGGSAAEPPGGAAGAPDGKSDPLEGTEWQLTSLPDREAADLAAVPGGVTVAFRAGAVQVFAGCNRLRGSYALDGDRLRLGPMAGTMMACPEPQMAVENAVKTALAGSLRVARTGDRLTLTTESAGDLVLARISTPVLDGTSWEVTGFNNGRDAVVSPIVGTTLTLSFRDGTLSGHAGCNTFRASYSVDGDRIAVGPAASTRKACAGEGVMEQERAYLAALESATTWKIERDLLDVHRADGQRVLTAKRVAAPAP